VPIPDYYKVADLVWKGMTVPEAARELGYNWGKMKNFIPIEVRGYLVDVSIMAGCREDYLGACVTTD
jgi:hypothetical protein